MSSSSPRPSAARRQPRGFSFLEVLLVLGIVGLMVLCLIGFVLSRHAEPLTSPAATPAPAKAIPVPAATPTP